MRLQPGPGTLFVKPVSEIPKQDKNKETGFGIKSDKRVPEEPYKFEVVAVGASMPVDGCFVSSPAYVGDIVSHSVKNASLREDFETSGFIVDGVHYLALDFRDVLGVWDAEVCNCRKPESAFCPQHGVPRGDWKCSTVKSAD